MAEKVEFRVGGHYENVKGVYEVISINPTQKKMCVRWENGEEIETAIELQERIIQNMKFRKMLSDKQVSSNLKYRIPQKHGSAFAGLEESDFKDNVVGTTWRSRESLGGAVSKLLYSKDYTFNSWAVYRMPEIQWADINHRKEERANKQAKFYAHISSTGLRYGFYIERSNSSEDLNLDWKTFLLWLKTDENEKWLKDICTSKRLKVVLFEWDEDEQLSEFEIKIDNSNWVFEANKKKIESITSYLENLPENRWVELYVTDSIGKNDVIKKQRQTAEDITDFFEFLMPLYEASIKHSK